MTEIQEMVQAATNAMKIIQRSKKGKLIDLERVINVDHASVYRWIHGIYSPHPTSIRAMKILIECGKELDVLNQEYEAKFNSMKDVYIERLNRLLYGER
jgi:hypothetical protein